MALMRWSVVVVTECADVLDHEGDVGVGDLALEEAHLGIGEAALRPSAEVHHDLDELFPVGQGVDGRHDLGRQRRQQGVKIIDGFALTVL
jgi:hypothetical protein